MIARCCIVFVMLAVISFGSGFLCLFVVFGEVLLFLRFIFIKMDVVRSCSDGVDSCMAFFQQQMCIEDTISNMKSAFL